MQAAVIKSRGQIPSTASAQAARGAVARDCSTPATSCSRRSRARRATNRNAATFTINLLRGGTAGQIVVVSKYASSDPRTAALGDAARDARPIVREDQPRPGRGRRPGRQPRRPDERHQVPDLARRRGPVAGDHAGAGDRAAGGAAAGRRDRCSACSSPPRRSGSCSCCSAARTRRSAAPATWTRSRSSACSRSRSGSRPCSRRCC